MSKNDINIFITDRKGAIHDVIAPTDMSINLMELIKIHEIENELQLECVVEWRCALLVNVI